MFEYHIKIPSVRVYPAYDIYDEEIELLNAIPHHKKVLLIIGFIVMSIMFPFVVYSLHYKVI
jgi:hypothetical protein